MQKCDVIAEHTPEGGVIPMRFRIREGDELIPVKIESYIELPHTHESRGMKRYKCRFVLHGVQRTCELWFYIKDARWEVSKLA